MSSDDLSGLLDPTAERALNEYLRSCETDPLPTPSRQEVLSDLVASIWRVTRRRVTRLADQTAHEVPDSIDPAFVTRLVDDSPEPMSAQCTAADWTLLDALPDTAYSQLGACYAFQYDQQELLLSPTELVSIACRQFLDEFETMRQWRRARHAVETCPAGEAVITALKLGDDASRLQEYVERHTFPTGSAPGLEDGPDWVVEAKNLDRTRERYRDRIRYTAAAFQVYAETATELASQDPPEAARVEFEDSSRPDGYLLPFYVPQRDGMDWVHGYEGSLRPLTAYLEESIPEQYETASTAYDDVASGRAHLVFVADTGRLPVGSTTGDNGQRDAPPWLVRALEQVRSHPFDDGHGGPAGPFEEERNWNPFAEPR